MGLIKIASTPVEVFLEHNDVPVDTVDQGDGPEDVFEIRAVVYNNHTGTPWRFNARDDQGTEWTITIAANEQGTRNIPPPQRYRSILQFDITLIR